jgi:hypothetical protein
MRNSVNPRTANVKREKGEKLVADAPDQELSSMHWTAINYRTMNARLSALLPCILVLSACGCSTVKTAKHYGNVDLDLLKTAYVIWSPNSDRTIESYAKAGLEAHGVKVTAGPREQKPSDVAFYVECEPQWWWDLWMYLSRLDIRFVDNSNGQVFAIGAFENSWFHSYPDSKSKTIEVINSMYRH